MANQVKSNHPIWRWTSKTIHQDFMNLGLTEKRSPDGYEYTSNIFEGSANYSTLINALLKALWHKEGLSSDNTEAGVAELRDKKILARLRSVATPTVVKYVVYDPDKGEVRGAAIDEATNKVKELCLDPEYGVNSDEVCHTDGCEVWMALLDTIRSASMEADSTASNMVDDAKANNAKGFEVRPYVFCDNVYKRATSEQVLKNSPDAYIKLRIPESGRIPRMTKDEIDGLKIRSTFWGDIKDTGSQSESEAVLLDRDKYKGIVSREWTEDQKKLIPVVPEYWSDTKAGQMICESFYMSKDDPNGNPVKSVYLEGVNGTSKTTLALYDVAAAMGCPAHIFQFSYSTSGVDITGSYVPKTTTETSDATKSFLESLPNEIDAKLDPVGSWKRLTGEDKPDVSEFQVLSMLSMKLKEHMKDEGESEDSVNFVYVPSPIVRAFKEGGVLILDEITVLANPGEVRALNGIIDGTTKVFETPEGPITVSDDCFIIGTGNPQTINQNCGEMDLSFRDRFQKVIIFEPPTTDRVIEVITQHGYLTEPKDTLVIERMAEVYEQVLSTMEARSIKGVISFRGMTEWSRDISYGYDFWESFKVNILNKLSSKARDREIILDAAQSLIS